MGEIVVDEDGGVRTTDTHVYHRLWPCVHHGPDVSCEEAQAQYFRETASGQRPMSGQRIGRVIRAEDR
jgi:hypothetical protein